MAEVMDCVTYIRLNGKNFLGKRLVDYDSFDMDPGNDGSHNPKLVSKYDEAILEADLKRGAEENKKILAGDPVAVKKYKREIEEINKKFNK